MEKTIGFIGSGNMAKAIIGGIRKSCIVSGKNIIVSAKTKESIEKIKEKYQVEVTLDNKEVARVSDYIIVAVKPFMYEEILLEIKDHMKEDTVIIGIAAGITIEYMKNILGKEKQIVKTMPNTPAMVGEGITALVFDDKIDENKKEEIINIFNSFGKTEILDEKLIDGFTAVAGSSPAYIYILIEAMADAAVLEGIPRKQAYKIASQAVLGAAKMVLETGIHPGELKDNVCSPGGATIDAVLSLEESGFRSSIMKAVKTCADKSKSMEK